MDMKVRDCLAAIWTCINHQTVTAGGDALVLGYALGCQQELAERGLVLLRVRDEIKMTISAYQTLYQSAVTFAMRKQLQAEHGKADLEKTIEQLEHKKTKLENKVSELKSKIDAIDKRNKERKEVEGKKRDQEIEFLRYQELHLNKFLKSVTDKQK